MGRHVERLTGYCPASTRKQQLGRAKPLSAGCMCSVTGRAGTCIASVGTVAAGAIAAWGIVAVAPCRLSRVSGSGGRAQPWRAAGPDTLQASPCTCPCSAQPAAGQERAAQRTPQLSGSQPLSACCTRSVIGRASTCIVSIGATAACLGAVAACKHAARAAQAAGHGTSAARCSGPGPAPACALAACSQHGQVPAAQRTLYLHRHRPGQQRGRRLGRLMGLLPAAGELHMAQS